MEKLKIRHFVLGELATNCFLIEQGKSAIVVDPAVPDSRIVQLLQAENLQLDFIINTHGHIDHIGGNTFLKEKYPQAQLVIFEKEVAYLSHPELNMSLELGAPYYSPPPDVVITEESLNLNWQGEVIQFFPSPGHTAGSVCLFFPAEKWLLSGDTLFAGSIGRTDLPGGDMSQLLDSLSAICQLFPPESKVFPGHGPFTELKTELESNPFLLEYLDL
ncbi:MAG: hydroxyacylglutathione hydrolase [Candidatus Atribacteria bacterium]|nr:hydroxyacylglutathione hydrolase [Candidatus Atribacteria bacterium]